MGLSHGFSVCDDSRTVHHSASSSYASFVFRVYRNKYFDLARSLYDADCTYTLSRLYFRNYPGNVCDSYLSRFYYADLGYPDSCVAMIFHLILSAADFQARICDYHTIIEELLGVIVYRKTAYRF